MLLLTGAYIPTDVQTIIKGSEFSLNIYEYLPIKLTYFYSKVVKHFEFGLTNSIISSVGIDDDSTIINTNSIIISLFWMIIFEISILLIRILLQKCKNNTKWTWFIKIFSFANDKFFKIMTFGYFIRNALELSQFIFISSVNEIYEHNTTDYLRWISLSYAILMIVIYLMILTFILYLIFSSYRLNENDHNKLEEFFIGLKSDKKWRLYSSILVIRRLVYIIMLITLSSISSVMLISILSFIQLIYWWYLMIARPYSQTRGNIIEIINEIYFTSLLFALIFLNTENDWNSALVKIYMTVIMSNVLIVFIIIILILNIG